MKLERRSDVFDKSKRLHAIHDHPGVFAGQRKIGHHLAPCVCGVFHSAADFFPDDLRGDPRQLGCRLKACESDDSCGTMTQRGKLPKAKPLSIW
jgi:hypothetical protein